VKEEIHPNLASSKLEMNEEKKRSSFTETDDEEE
jgi:hypothetical protein